MNKNEEGSFYASMVRKYKSECGQRTLQQFCAAEKISYSKMLNCTGRESYRASQRTNARQHTSNPSSSVGIKPLVIDSPKSETAVTESAKFVAVDPSSNTSIGFDEVRINITSKINMTIGHCDVKSLVMLVKEMEGSLC